MKRYLPLLLVLVLLLAACDSNYSQNYISFYYPRDFRQPAGAPIDTFYAAEHREATGNPQNLRYLLTLYLRGPLEDDLISPFPENTRLVDLDLHAGRLYIQLSQEIAQLSDIDLTIACSCISLTCFDLADVDQVTIMTPATDNSPAVEVTISREDLIFTDTVTGESNAGSRKDIQ